MSDVRCPDCGSHDVARIVFGLVAPGMHPDDVLLGGCVVGPEPVPNRACRACGHQWRLEPVMLEWPDPRAHDDGDVVMASGVVGRVVLDATSEGGVWADFQLVPSPAQPPVRCLAFPRVFGSLDVALEPGLEVGVVGRISRSGPSGFELHVQRWELVEV